MRWTKVVALATAGTLSLAACGGSDSGDKKPNGSDPASNAPAAPVGVGMDPKAVGPAKDPANAKKGGTLTVAYNSKPETFDPSRNYFQDTNAISSTLVVRSLTTWRTDANDKSILVPDLATDLGRQSTDGLSWEFTLKDGLKYEDGSPIKAADFVYAVKRAMAKEELPDGPTFDQEFFKGGDTYKGVYKDKGDFAAVQAKDEKTLVFNMRKKWDDFPYYASFAQMSPIPQAKDTKEKYGDRPLATGPYKFASYKKGSELKLVKNANWNAASDPARHQLVDGYHFKFGVEPNSTQQGILASNGTDATTLNWDAVEAPLVQKVRTTNKDQFVGGLEPCVSYMTLDTRKIPLEVRKAIALAYPFDSWNKANGLTSLSTAPGTSLIAPQVPGITPHPPVYGVTGVGDGNPAAAKAALAAAGKPNFELSWYYPSDDKEAQKANQVKKQKFEAAGFKVRDVGVPLKELRKTRQDAASSGKVNTGQGPVGWCYDWPTAISVYQPLFSSAVIASGNSVGFLTDKKLDSEMARIGALPAAQQGPEWTKFDENLLKDHLPAIITRYNKSNFLFGKKVHNVMNNPHQGMPDLSAIWVG